MNKKHLILADNGTFMFVRFEGLVELWNSKGTEKIGVLPGNIEKSELKKFISTGTFLVTSSAYSKLRSLLGV